jgi:hypothetical protein
LRRNFLLKHVIEETIEGMGRRERRRKQLLDDLRKIRYWNLKKDALVALCGEVALEGAMDHSQGGLPDSLSVRQFAHNKSRPGDLVFMKFPMFFEKFKNLLLYYKFN